MFKDTLLGMWELGVQSEDFLASCHFQVCFSSLWYAISLTYPVLLLLQLCKSSSRLQQSTGRQLRSRNVSYYIICSRHRHIFSLSLSLSLRGQYMKDHNGRLHLQRRNYTEAAIVFLIFLRDGVYAVMMFPLLL